MSQDWQYRKSHSAFGLSFRAAFPSTLRRASFAARNLSSRTAIPRSPKALARN